MLPATLILSVVAAAPPTEAFDREALAASSLAFGLDLMRRLPPGPRENLVVSPHGALIALAIPWCGATGPTARAFDSALRATIPAPRFHSALAALNRAPSRVAGATRLELSTRLALEAPESISEAFRDEVANRYDTAVEQGPRGPIVVQSRVGFRGTWNTPFDPALTRTAPFHGLDGKPMPVQLMSQELSTAAASVSGVEAVRLGYEGGAVSLLLLMPPAGQFERFVRDLDGPRLARLRAALVGEKVHLSLPRFSIQLTSALSKPLQQMGLKPAFEPSANFSGLSKVTPLWLGDVSQEASISVNERETVATADTRLTIIGGIDDSTPRKIAFDRPFVFAVIDDTTGALYFLGQFTHP